MTPVERVRTSSRAFERMVDYARQRHDSGADGWCVQHINAPEPRPRAGRARAARSSAASRPSSSEIGPVLAVAHRARAARHRRPAAAASCAKQRAVRRAARIAPRCATPPARRRPHRADRRRGGGLPVPDLPAAQADQLAPDRRVPGGRAVRPRSTSSTRHMRRGFAIALVYLGLLAVPFALIALIVPPLITEGNNFAENVPELRARRDRLRRGATSACASSTRTTTSPRSSRRRPASCPPSSAAPPPRCATWASAIVNSLFALITILVLTAFMLGSGRQLGGRRAALATTRAARAPRALARPHGQRGGRLRGGGAAASRSIAGVATYIVLTILGVPFAAPLARDRRPLLADPARRRHDRRRADRRSSRVFEDFPTATIIWVIWAIVYQQFENHVIQPQMQKRTVNVNPFLTIVSVLFGSDAARDPGRAAGDPGRRLDPDPAARVLRPAHAVASSARRHRRRPPSHRRRRATGGRPGPGVASSSVGMSRDRRAAAACSRSPPCRCTCSPRRCSRCSAPGTGSTT